jgi:chromosome segregation ATPase
VTPVPSLADHYRAVAEITHQLATERDLARAEQAEEHKLSAALALDNRALKDRLAEHEQLRRGLQEQLGNLESSYQTMVEGYQQRLDECEQALADKRELEELAAEREGVDAVLESVADELEAAYRDPDRALDTVVDEVIARLRQTVRPRAEVT